MKVKINKFHLVGNWNWNLDDNEHCTICMNNYEILNAYLNRFLKIYNEEIINDNEIKENLNKINELNINKYEKLEELYNNTMCLISYFGKIQI